MHSVLFCFFLIPLLTHFKLTNCPSSVTNPDLHHFQKTFSTACTHTHPHTRMTFLESRHPSSAGRTVGVLEVLWLPIRTSACRGEKAFESNSNREGGREGDRYRRRQADQTDGRQRVGNHWIVSQVVRNPRVKREDKALLYQGTWALRRAGLQEEFPLVRQQDAAHRAHTSCQGPLLPSHPSPHFQETRNQSHPGGGYLWGAVFIRTRKLRPAQLWFYPPPPYLVSSVSKPLARNNSLPETRLLMDPRRAPSILLIKCRGTLKPSTPLCWR